MRVAIRQLKSGIGRGKGQKATIRALGLRHPYQEVVHEDSVQIRGMIQKVSHLVEVREIDD